MSWWSAAGDWRWLVIAVLCILVVYWLDPSKKQKLIWFGPLQEFAGLQRSDVDNLVNILKIARMDNYKETLPRLRASFSYAKKERFRAWIQIPPILTAKNRAAHLDQ